TREVPDGQDEKGNPKTKTETYYVTDPVTPTFENILSDSFDQGDNILGVIGLSDIQSRAAEMVKAESGPRKLIAAVHDFAVEIGESYTQAVTSGPERDKLISSGKDLLKRVNAAIPKQAKYAEMSDADIRRQYDRDVINNFHKRNAWMLSRLQNAQAYLTVI